MTSFEFSVRHPHLDFLAGVDTWPEKPFLALTSAQRKNVSSRLQVFDWRHLMAFSSSIDVSQPVSWVLFKDPGTGEKTHVLLEIDWREQDQTLIRRFDLWLKHHRGKRTPRKRQGNTGAGDALKWLAATRLLKTMDWKKAIDFGNPYLTYRHSSGERRESHVF